MTWVLTIFLFAVPVVDTADTNPGDTVQDGGTYQTRKACIQAFFAAYIKAAVGPQRMGAICHRTK